MGKETRQQGSRKENVIPQCAACGTMQAREMANFCFVCGKKLSEGYQPLDSIRSSYNLQGKKIFPRSQVSRAKESLFVREDNGAAQAAWASFVYSMVPYLGILFIPFTLIIGIYALNLTKRMPHLGGRIIARVAIFGSFMVAGFQVFLWWLLYKIPEIVQQVP